MSPPVGVLIGVPVALAASRSIQSMLFGLTATDPLVMGSAVAIMALAGVIASYVPARRASRVDPLTSLRQD
jgi:hypothetical protein